MLFLQFQVLLIALKKLVFPLLLEMIIEHISASDYTNIHNVAMTENDVKLHKILNVEAYEDEETNADIRDY